MRERILIIDDEPSVRELPPAQVAFLGYAHSTAGDGREGVRLASLTPREREVFDAVASGKLNKQIAGDLRMAERTVKLHRAQVMEKLSVGFPAGLGRLAERVRLLSDPPSR